MAAIFPPASDGGVPPGTSVPNGYTPTHPVVGEGPLYFAPDCTTLLPASQPNAVISEVAAAVDRLGFAFNTGIVTNLGDALAARLVSQLPAGGAPGQALVINDVGAPMWGEPIDGGTF